MDTVDQILLFVVDGLRPDALPLASTPRIDRLIAQGASTMHARCTMPSVTLPCHVSLFLGCGPERHGVISNTWQAPDPPVPSLLEIAHRLGLRSGAFYTWEQLRDLAPPGTLDVSCYRRLGEPEEGHMREIAAAAADFVAQPGPKLAFVYLEATDQAGHRHGWMSEPYLDAVAECDRAVDMVLGALPRPIQWDRTAVLLTSDHGGHDRRHGADIPEDMTIPWIVAAPVVRAGCQLQEPVGIADTAPTLLRLLGAPAPSEWTGHAVTEAFRA
jgi:predicted AlkP superfamily pyrophosphatase or phosphodiesterase